MSPSAFARDLIGPTRRCHFPPLLVLCGCLLAVGCQGGRESVLNQLAEARRLTAELRIQFGQAAAASSQAVMADSDDKSRELGQEAERSKRRVDETTTMLSPLLQRLQYPAESQLLDEFARNFRDYQSLDRSILELAIENSNIKAQKLSFGPAHQAVAMLKGKLAAIVQAAPPPQRCQIESVAAGVLLAVRELEVLEPPHIAESSDAEMTRMEQEMAALTATADRGLASLASLGEPTLTTLLADANAALAQFAALHAKILALSRRNSNVRSLELALGRGRSLRATCDSNLSALQEALAKEGFKATR